FPKSHNPIHYRHHKMPSKSDRLILYATIPFLCFFGTQITLNLSESSALYIFWNADHADFIRFIRVLFFWDADDADFQTLIFTDLIIRKNPCHPRSICTGNKPFINPFLCNFNCSILSASAEIKSSTAERQEA